MHKVDLITDNLNYLCTPRKIPFINVNDVTLQRTEKKKRKGKKKREKKKRKKESPCTDGKEIVGIGRDAGSQVQDASCQSSFTCLPPPPPLVA